MSKRKPSSDEGVKTKKRKERKSFNDGRTNEETFALPEPEGNADELFVIDKKGVAMAKASTDSWRAKPLKSELVLNALLGRTGLERKKTSKPKKVRGGGAIVSNPPVNVRVRSSALVDPWAEKPVVEESPWEQYWIPANKAERELARDKQLAKREVYVPPAAMKRANAPLSEVPKNGLSYNPDRESHQDVLGEATAYEMKIAMEEKKLKKKLKIDKSLPDDSIADAQTLAEMVEFVRGGMQVKFDPNKDGDEGVVREKSGPKSKKKKKRKVDAIRKRALRQKRKEKLGKQIAHLGMILLSVEKEEEKERMRLEKKRLKKALEQSSTRKVGRHLFQPQRPAVLLDSDLPSSLRTMGNEKPLQGNRVADAFESLQRRNIVAVTKKQKKHKK